MRVFAILKRWNAKMKMVHKSKILLTLIYKKKKYEEKKTQINKETKLYIF